MTEVADHVSTRTVLNWGTIEAPVALFKTTKDRPLPSFEKASPTGGEIRREDRTREAPADADADAPVPVISEEVSAEIAQLRMQVNEADAALSDAGRKLADLMPKEVETYSVFVDPNTGEEYEADEMLRGLFREGEAGKEFIDLTQALEKADEQTGQKEMRVVGFVRVDSVPRSRIIGGYYLGGDGEGAPKVLRLLYEGMRARRKVAVVKWVKTSRQALGVVLPLPRQRGALCVVELAWAEDFLAPGPRMLTHQQAEVTESEVATATGLVEAMEGTVETDLDALSDDRRRLYRQIKEAAEEGDVPVIQDLPVKSGEGDLMAALEESVRRADEFTAVA